MDEINPLSKFLSPLISFICGKDTISVPGIICGTIWGSFPVLRSFAVQFGDHLRYWDHLRAGIICGAVHIVREHVYSRGKFVKKANHLANCVQGTSNNKKSDVAKCCQVCNQLGTDLRGIFQNDIKRSA